MKNNPPEVDFAELLRANQSRIYGFIHSLVRNLDDTDDLFQQTSVVLWNKFAQYDPTRSFFAWACGIARFEINNFLRSRSRQKLYFTDDLNLLLMQMADTFTVAETDARQDALQFCMQKLRHGDREIIQECYSGAKNIHSAAEKRGRSKHSIHNSLRRIRRALMECIERTLAMQTRTGGNA
ncbi:MAG: sigma-70 family RNA polymerase sigma factor [Zavarzinella sp.]